MPPALVAAEKAAAAAADAPAARRGHGLPHSGSSKTANTTTPGPPSRIGRLLKYSALDWSDHDLGLDLSTTQQRLRLYALRRAKDGGEPVYGRILRKLKDASADSAFSDHDDPTDIYVLGHAARAHTAKDEAEEDASDFQDQLLDRLRKRGWDEDEITALRDLLELVAYSVLRESGLRAGHTEKSKPPYDPIWTLDSTWFSPRYDTKFDPDEPVRLNTPTVTNAWEALFEDQIELAKPEAEVWIQSFDTLLVFVGLLSSVIAGFVTSYPTAEDSGASQTAIAGYRISLLLTLMTGVISLRVRSGLSRLNSTAARLATPDELSRVNVTLAARLLEYCQRMDAARHEAPWLLSASAIILQVAIFLFLASFVTSIHAQSSTPGDQATFVTTLVLTILCALFLLWTLSEGLFYPSVFSGGQISRFLRFLHKTSTTALDKATRIVRHREETDLPTAGAGRRLEFIAKSQSLTFFRLAAGVDRRDRADLVGAAVYQTLVEHCPEAYTPSASVIAEGLQNLIRLGSQTMLSDVLNCAVIMYDRDFSSSGSGGGDELAELDQACRLMGRSLKVSGESNLADQAYAAAALLRAVPPDYSGADLRYLLSKLLVSPRAPCLSPLRKDPRNERRKNVIMKIYTHLRNSGSDRRQIVIFHAVNSVPADEHLCLGDWGLRRLAWDVHIRRRTDLWSCFKCAYQLFARFEKPCGHGPDDAECQWKPTPLPFFLNHARRIALGQTYDEYHAQQDALASGADTAGAASLSEDVAAASAAASVDKNTDRGEIVDLLRLMQTTLDRLVTSQATEG